VYTRADRLERLAGVVPAERLPRALELTRDLAADPDAAFMATGVLAALAPRLDNGAVREAFALACALRGPDALLALAPRLPEDLVVPAFEAAAEWGGASEALAALASRLPDDVVPGALARCGPWEYPAVLAALGPRLSHDQLAGAIATAGELWGYTGPHVLAAVSPHLTADLLPAAVAAASQGADRASALAAIAPHLPEAVEPALQTATPELLPHVVAAVAESLPAPRRDELQRAALAGLEDLTPAERASGVVALLPRLAGEQRTRALALLDPAELHGSELDAVRDELSDADVAARLEGLDPDEDLDVLLALAPRLTLADVLSMFEEEDLAYPLTALIPHLPESERDGAVATALAAARAIDDAFERAHALAALLPFLPDDERVQVPSAAEAFAELCAAPDPYRVMREVPALAPRLSDDELERAVGLCAGLSDLDIRAVALVELAPSLAGELRERALAAVEGPLHHAPPLERLAAVDAEAAASIVELVTEPRARVLAVEMLAGAPAITPPLLHAHMYVALRLAASHGLATDAVARLAPALGRLT
jgi:hypothetical protein